MMTEAEEAEYAELRAGNPEAYAAMEEHARKWGEREAEWALAGGMIAALLFGSPVVTLHPQPKETPHDPPVA